MQRIKIDPNRCIGCRQCELVCSLNHKENVLNPRRARIRVISENGYFFPVIAGQYTDAACNTKAILNTPWGEVDLCVLCRASCPQKSFFYEPDTGFHLKCDFCGTPPNPACVKVCNANALELIEVPD
jgi:benzoyl-CoA reductase subunit BamC